MVSLISGFLAKIRCMIGCTNKKALEYFEKALPISRSVGYRFIEATTLSNIGSLYSDLGQYKKALEYFDKALSIRHTIGDREGEAGTLNNIASVYSTLGQNQKTLELYEKALKIWREVGHKKGEATTLSNIGSVYSALGQKQKALEYYNKALPINQAVGDRTGEATTLNNIGVVYSDFGQKQKALVYYNKALTITQAVGDRTNEATTLSNIGSVYSALGQKQKALEYYNKALPINQAVGDRTGEAMILNNIGIVYSDLGEKQKALEYYNKALLINQAVGDRLEEATTLNNIGLVYSYLGQEQKALDYYNKALPIRQAVGDRSGEATTFNNIGIVYSDLGEKQKALEYYNKALPINQEVGDRLEEATTLNNIGLVYSDFGQKRKALKYYNKALPIWQAVGNREGEATTLNNIGSAYHSLGENVKALEYFEKVLPIDREVGYCEGEAGAFHNMMFSLKIFKKIRVSIFYGKLSVNLYQKLRVNISGLEKKLQKSYLESKKFIYRLLASLLITEGRLSEAQQVLDMLKEQEFFEFIRKDRAAAAALSTQVDFTEFERQWLENYNATMEKLAKVSREYHELKFKNNRSESEEKKLEELESRVKEETRVYEDFIAHMKEAFDRHEKEIQAGKIPPDVVAKKANELQDTLKELDEKEGSRHAALHYLIYKGHMSVILTTPSRQMVKQTDIDEQESNRMIMDYRNFMMEAGRGIHRIKPPNDRETIIIKKIKSYEKDFYDVMFKAVDEKLKKYGATNLVVSLDGVLRYLPLAALWDGENYLLQQYRIAIVTPSSLKNIKEEPIKEKRILGLGASQGSQELPPLPNVPAEIRSIVKDEENGYYGLIKGKAFIDDDFTKDRMVNQIRDVGYPLVHIASHFKFSPGDETKNHLLLGDGTFMKLSEIRRMGKLFNNVKLLVLSACQTGVGGNGEEIDGFGELAQQSGAKSVVASLWPVADESTKDLMMTFYGKLKEGKVTGKIEALRQAQLELAGLEDLLAKDKNQADQSNRQKTEYSHPYYWGPFIMMGNWR
jgi:CHAT domain-containing protein/tetratricopeptide (TPR) repeat protein